MHKHKLDQTGLIPLLVTIFLLVVGLIILVFLRVSRAQQ